MTCKTCNEMANFEFQKSKDLKGSKEIFIDQIPVKIPQDIEFVATDMYGMLWGFEQKPGKWRGVPLMCSGLFIGRFCGVHFLDREVAKNSMISVDRLTKGNNCYEKMFKTIKSGEAENLNGFKVFGHNELRLPKGTKFIRLSQIGTLLALNEIGESLGAVGRIKNLETKISHVIDLDQLDENYMSVDDWILSKLAYEKCPNF